MDAPPTSNKVHNSAVNTVDDAFHPKTIICIQAGICLYSWDQGTTMHEVF